jgi:hypothetical protein
MTFEGGFEGESVKLIGQYVGRNFIIVLAVSTFGQMATGVCYCHCFVLNSMLSEVERALCKPTSTFSLMRVRYLPQKHRPF